MQPQCNTVINGNQAIARPGLRLADFVSQFGTRGKYYSVCQSDYTAALGDIGSTLATILSPCLEGQVDTTDTNLANPGLQPQCTVSDFLHYGTAQQTETEELDPCRMLDPTTPDPAGSRPCWWIEMNQAACPDPVATPSHLELHVERGSQTAPPGTTQVISCVTDR